MHAKCAVEISIQQVLVSKKNKSPKIYTLLYYKLSIRDLFHCRWISAVNNILDGVGFYIILE